MNRSQALGWAELQTFFLRELKKWQRSQIIERGIYTVRFQWTSK